MMVEFEYCGVCRVKAMSKRINDDNSPKNEVIWLTPDRQSQNVITLIVEESVYKMPQRLYRYLGTIQQMVIDLGEMGMSMEAEIPLAIQRVAWEYIIDCLNTIDLWAADAVRVQNKLTQQLEPLVSSSVGDVNEFLPLSLLVVANYLDCTPLITVLLEIVASQFKQAFKPNDFTTQEQRALAQKEMKPLIEDINKDYTVPLDLSSEVFGMNEARQKLEQYGVPYELAIFILRRMVTRQRPLIACFGSHGLIVGPRGTLMFATGYLNDYLTATAIGLKGNTDIIENKQTTLVAVPGIRGRIVSMATNSAHTVILTTEGLFGVGYNIDGCLTSLEKDVNVFTPLVLEGLEGQPISVACGHNFTLVHTDHGVYGCGSNRYGQLAHTNATMSFTTAFVRLELGLPSNVNALRIACGAEHTLILTSGGLYACGNNQSGQLGLTNTAMEKMIFRLKLVPGLPSVENIIGFSAGINHSVVVTDKELYGTGLGSYYGMAGEENSVMTRLAPRIESDPHILGVACGETDTTVWTTRSCYVVNMDIRLINETSFAGTFVSLSTNYEWAGIVTNVSCGRNVTLFTLRSGEVVRFLAGSSRNNGKLPLPESLFSAVKKLDNCRQCGHFTPLQETTQLRQSFCAVCQWKFYSTLKKSCVNLSQCLLKGVK
jgi:Regulator of chromosome condensation (RCC1) repeat